MAHQKTSAKATLRDQYAFDLLPLPEDTLRHIYTHMAIHKIKNRLALSTANDAINTIRKHYPEVTFPFSREDLQRYVDHISHYPSLGAQTVHARYLKYYLAAHLSYYSLRHQLGHNPTKEELSTDFNLLPKYIAYLRPLNHFILDIQNENEDSRTRKEKTSLDFADVLAAREKARLDTLRPKPPLKVLNAYIILMLSTYGPPPRSSEISRIQVSLDSPPPTSGNIIFQDSPDNPDNQNAAGCTLILREHKNSHLRGSSAEPVILTYPPIVWQEIQRIRSLVPPQVLSAYLISGRKPPVTKKQIANVIAPYLIIPDSVSRTRFAYTNRDLRQAYAKAHPDMDPRQLMHTKRTHDMDYRPPGDDEEWFNP
jgi:hypothetical protein